MDPVGQVLLKFQQLVDDCFFYQCDFFFLGGGGREKGKEELFENGFFFSSALGAAFHILKEKRETQGENGS